MSTNKTQNDQRETHADQKHKTSSADVTVSFEDVFIFLSGGPVCVQGGLLLSLCGIRNAAELLSQTLRQPTNPLLPSILQMRCRLLACDPFSHQQTQF